jgi:hypothetical protein
MVQTESELIPRTPSVPFCWSPKNSDSPHRHAFRTTINKGRSSTYVLQRIALTLQSQLLGNSGKICHPQNVGFDEIHEISFQGRWIYEDLGSWTCEDLVSWTCEAPKSRTCEDLESWTCEALKSRTCEDLEPESVKFGNLLKIKFGGYGAWRFLWIKDSRTGWKPSQRRCLKSPGLACELVAGL